MSKLRLKFVRIMLLFVILLTPAIILDNIDKNLLSLLSENSRMSTSELSRKLDVSRSTVQGRLERLERSNTIQRFTIDLSDEYERSLIKAHVLIKVDQAITGRVLPNLKKLPEITAVYSVSGEYDMIAVVAATSTGELNRLLDQIAALEGLVRTNSSVVLETKLRR